MIEYDSFIYLDVYKTGSSYVYGLLRRLHAARPQRIDRHAPLTKGRPFFWKRGKLAFATVRNPWDWYVSMWTYSMQQPNVLFFRNARSVLGAEGARELFDPDNPRHSFDRWLRSINDPETLGKIMAEHPYSRSPVNAFLGFYSYRFMRVTTPHPDLFLRRWYVRNMSDAIAWQKRSAIYDTVLKCEGLSTSFADFALENRERCGFRPDTERILARLASTPRNTSNRAMTHYRDYYSDELRQLVARRDQLIIDLFGYRF